MCVVYTYVHMCADNRYKHVHRMPKARLTARNMIPTTVNNHDSNINSITSVYKYVYLCLKLDSLFDLKASAPTARPERTSSAGPCS